VRCRTIHVERSAPATEQRAANSFCSLPLGRSQVTARERISRVNAALAAAPQDHALPPAPLQVASAPRTAMPDSLMTTPPETSEPPSRTVTR